MRFPIASFLGLAVLSVFSLAAERERVSTEEAFRSYDDGRIGYAELLDLLRLIETGEMEDACALWESYGGDPCERTLAARLSALNFHGKVLSSVSLDSTGNVTAGRESAALEFGRFSADARSVFGGGKSPTVERWRVRYGDKGSFAVLGRLTAADLGSAIPIEKEIGYAGLVKFRSLESGALLLTDSSAGCRLGFGDRDRFRVSGLGIASRDGFRDAFVRVRVPGTDGTVVYSRGWRSPLFYLAASASGAPAASFRFRFYYRGNGSFGSDSLSRFFRLPSTVVESRAWWSSIARFAWKNWTFRWDDRLSIPADTGKIRTAFGVSAFRLNGDAASVGGEIRGRTVGDSVLATLSASGGLRLSSADSLFAEFRLSPKTPWRETLFEIRPGVQRGMGEWATIRLLWIARGPGSPTPLSTRGETEMRFSPYCSGRISFDFRGVRWRTAALRRLNVEISGNW